MTTYPLKDLSLAALIAAFFDPDVADTVTFKKINGVDIDWVALAGSPHVVTLTKGSVKFWPNGKTTPPVYDDGGSLSGHPQIGQELNDGAITYTLTDGTHEVGPFTLDITLSGVATAPPPPALENTLAPSISGATTVGATLTATAGTWAGNGTVNVTRRWTADGVDIPGETGTTYVTVSGDVGKTIRCVEDATDATPSSSSASSNGIGVTPISLANTAAPSFTGTPTAGNTLTYVPGTWVGTGTVTKSVQSWNRDGVPISGATGNTYVLQAADVGHQVGLTEYAADSLTSGTANSSTVTVSAASTVNATVLRSNVDDEFASDPEKGWEGFDPGDSMTVVTATSPDQAKALQDSWAAGTPSSQKLDIVCDWDGLISGAALRWFGPPTAKLTSDPSSLYGYSLGTGGVRLRAAPGKSPKFDSRLQITGLTRLEIDGVGFAGKRDGITNNTAYALKTDRSASYPTNGLIALKNLSLGHLDNRPSLVSADLCHGFNYNGAKSVYLKNVRLAGLKTSTLGWSEYIYAELIDVQQTNEDIFAVRGYTGSYSSRSAWVKIKTLLARDSLLVATAQHPDIVQLGTGADAHLGYYYSYEQILAHMRVDTTQAANVGAQAFYNDDATSPRKFQGSIQNGLVAVDAYHGFSMWDPSQAGHNIGEKVAFYRSGSTASSGDTYPWVNVPHGGANGGIRQLDDCSMTTINGGAQASLVLNNCRYVSPRKNKAAGGNGLTAATAKRMEEVVLGTGGTFNRDGSDYMTYTIAGESGDFAHAFWAMRDFYEPIAGYGSAGQPDDPGNWAGVPARP